MNDVYCTKLKDRSILSITGPDTLAFLQGIVTNDMEKLVEKKMQFSAILTPQGKYLYDFFIFSTSTDIFIDCQKDTVDALEKTLNMYRLRAKVEINNRRDAFSVFSIIRQQNEVKNSTEDQYENLNKFNEIMTSADPRLTQLGTRAIIPNKFENQIIPMHGFIEKNEIWYKHLQMSLGVADYMPNSVLRRYFPLELGFNELNAVSFTKGCYVGQEVTARMKVRNLVKKRLVPVSFQEEIPATGSNILSQGKGVGEILAVTNNQGLAMFRIEALNQALNEDRELLAENTLVKPTIPPWFNLKS